MMIEAANENVKEALSLTVLFDGACPLCRREIGVYRGLQPLQPDAQVCFADVSDAAAARHHARATAGALSRARPRR